MGPISVRDLLCNSRCSEWVNAGALAASSTLPAFEWRETAAAAAAARRPRAAAAAAAVAMQLHASISL